MLGCHLNRYNRNKVRQARRLVEVNEQRGIPFDRFSLYQEALLRRLWVASMGADEPVPTRSSEQWKKLGFQVHSRFLVSFFIVDRLQNTL